MSSRMFAWVQEAVDRRPRCNCGRVAEQQGLTLGQAADRHAAVRSAFDYMTAGKGPEPHLQLTMDFVRIRVGTKGEGSFPYMPFVS